MRYLKIHSVKFQNFHTSLRSWKIYNSLEKYTINSANKVSSYKWFQRIGKRLGTSSADLTYGTIETIIIYNALLPICWAPINFVAAVTFIRFYRSFSNKRKPPNNDDSDDGGDDNNDKKEDEDIKSIDEKDIESNVKMEMMDKRGDNQFLVELFDIAHDYWLGIQPSTICLRLGVIEDDDIKVYDVFNSYRSSY